MAEALMLGLGTSQLGRLGLRSLSSKRTPGSPEPAFTLPSRDAVVENKFYRDGSPIDWARWQRNTDQWVWPPQDEFPNGGVIGTHEIMKLNVGQVVDRCGVDSGRYLAPADTPFGARSLPPTSLSDPYSRFEVLKPFNVEASRVEPWFEKPGGGTQYFTGEKSVQWLIDNGYLKRLP
jgi:hypothetical protein